MDKAAEILIIIVSSFMSLFLIIVIILGIRLIQVANRLKTIVQSAEKIAASAESIGEMLGKSAKPLSSGRFIYHLVDAVFKRAHK